MQSWLNFPQNTTSTYTGVEGRGGRLLKATKWLELCNFQGDMTHTKAHGQYHQLVEW